MFADHPTPVVDSSLEAKPLSSIYPVLTHMNPIIDDCVRRGDHGRGTNSAAETEMIYCSISALSLAYCVKYSSPSHPQLGLGRWSRGDIDSARPSQRPAIDEQLAQR
jgi:hypothetical protein